MKIVMALKRLAVALGCATNESKVKGRTAAEVIDFIAANLPAKNTAITKNNVTKE